MEFGELDFQHAVLEISSCPGFVNAGDVEGTGHLAVAALTADVVAFIVLLIIVFLPLGREGEIVVFVAERNILLFEARKVGGKFVGRAVVFDIDFEARSAECTGEGGIKGIQQAIEQTSFFLHKLITCCKWNQTKHGAQSPFMDIETNFSRGLGNPSLFPQPLAIIIIPIKVKMSIGQKEKSIIFSGSAERCGLPWK